jgi:regulator of sigma E protease
MYIVIAIVMFGVLIGIHEFGHFTAAKACGVKVNEFAIGMGPAIVKKQKGETLYALRALPIGGYCAMEGEEDDSDDPRAFMNKRPWQKLIILIAGSFMNYLLGVILLMIVFSTAAGFVQPVIKDFMNGCPYESADGLQAGDRFYSIDGKRIHFASDITDLLGSGGEHDIVLIRSGQKVALKDYDMELVQYEGESSPKYGLYFESEPNNLWTNFKYSLGWSVEFVRMVWDGLTQLVTGVVGIKDMSGPVGIVTMMTDVGENSATKADAALNILYFCAFIAINLSVMNMLPIPALDGGRVFLLVVTTIVQGVMRRRVNPKIEAYINAAGMVMLLGLMAVVMYNDIAKLVVK